MLPIIRVSVKRLPTCPTPTSEKMRLWYCVFKRPCSNTASIQLDNKCCATADGIQLDSFYNFNSLFDEKEDWKRNFTKTMLVYPEFISSDEECQLLKELEPYMSRLHYEDSHWDDAIHKYRETEKSRWTKGNEIIINRVRSTAFPAGVSPLKFVHVLDLAADGVIKPHVDSVRFCGSTIAGLSLLSSCVMRLRLEKQRDLFCDVYLPRRSLYIMKDFTRYEFTHEVLGPKESKFKEHVVKKDRRISVICRNSCEDTSSTSSIFSDVKPLPPE